MVPSNLFWKKWGCLLVPWKNSIQPKKFQGWDLKKKLGFILVHQKKQDPSYPEKNKLRYQTVPKVMSVGICPSGWIPCSRQYNSQAEFPIWIPAWPTWIDITSLIFCKTIGKLNQKRKIRKSYLLKIGLKSQTEFWNLDLKKMVPLLKGLKYQFELETGNGKPGFWNPRKITLILDCWSREE